MRIFSCIALVAVSVLGSALAQQATVYQPVHVSGNATYVSTVRFSNLNFTGFDANASYSASFCGTTPVEIVSLNKDYAVITLDQRPVPRKCPLAVKDASGEVVYSGPVVEFLEPVPRRPLAFALDVVPSFYAANLGHRTRVTVVAPFLGGLIVVKSIGGEGECTDVRETTTAFTCLLPAIPANRIDPNIPVYFEAIAPFGTTLFSVQAVKDPRTHVKAVAPATLSSGAQFTLTLSRPLETVRQLPWTPVLADAAGAAVDSARFTGLEWNAAGSELTAAVACPDCAAGTYTVHLGEAIPSIAGPVLFSNVTIDFVATGTPLEGAPETAPDSDIDAAAIAFLAVGGAAILAVAGLAAWRWAASRKQKQALTPALNADLYISEDSSEAYTTI
jgi:hypothetical protein